MPADLGMPAADIVTSAPPPALTPSPTPAPNAAPSFGLEDPFAGLESSDSTQTSVLPGLSPSSSGFPPAPVAADPALDLFGVGSGSTAAPNLFMGSMGPAPTGASHPLPAQTHSQGLFNSMMGQAPAQGFYQPPVNMPVAPGGGGAGGINPFPSMATAAIPPGSPSLGMGGSPARIMTRGGKAPASPNLSASHSGPGLEDAVKALGLAMSPAKTTSGAKANVSKPQSRPLSPGQPIMGGMSSGVDLGEGRSVSPGAPGGYGVEGGVHGVDPLVQAGMPDQEAGLSGQGTSLLCVSGLPM